MNIKQTVITENTDPRIWYALGVADTLHQQMLRTPITVTSMRDGIHGPNSLHPAGQAADIRTRHLSTDRQTAFLLPLKAMLYPLGFDVILESDHIHIEYDPKDSRHLIDITA
jgi:hypothetical protein